MLNGGLAPGRPWLDLTYHSRPLLRGRPGPPGRLPVDALERPPSEPLVDGGGRVPPRRPAGLVLAAVVGGTGLAFYLMAYALGVDLTVVAEDLPAVWSRCPCCCVRLAERARGVRGRRLPRPAAAADRLRDPGRSGPAPSSAAATTSTRASAASSATRSWVCCSAWLYARSGPRHAAGGGAHRPGRVRVRRLRTARGPREWLPG